MPSRSDIKAGSAFVELGTNASKLIKGLRTAMKRVRTFANDASAIGSRVSLFGTAGATGLIAATKQFRDVGAAMDRLRTTTGLGAIALAGLEKAAADNDVSLEQLGTALTKYSNNIGKGGAEVETALGRIGVSIDELRSMSPEDQISLIADRLPKLTTESERVATAMALMGRNGAALIPVFSNGAKGLNDAAKAAQETGQAMDDEALDAAVKLDIAFNDLSSASLGVGRAIGEALGTTISDLVGGVTNVVVGIAAWIKNNPDLVRTILNVSVAVGVLGAGVAALAVTFLAATSPIGITIALLAAVGASALAVTDMLGITSTGFSDLFNSIRIDGQGLGTWLTKFWTFVLQGWENLRFGIASAWDWLVTKAANAGDRIYDAFAWIIEPLRELFGDLVDWLIGAFRKVVGWVQDLVGWPRRSGRQRR